MSKGKVFSLATVIGDLRDQCDAAGGVRAWTSERGLDHSGVVRVLSGRRAPGPTLLEALGYERIDAYRKVDG